MSGTTNTVPMSGTTNTVPMSGTTNTLPMSDTIFSQSSSVSAVDQTFPFDMFRKTSASVANLPPSYVKLFNKICEDIRNALKFDQDSNIPLHDAVIDCDWARVKSQCIVLQGIKSNLNHRNLHGETALMLAVKLAVRYGDEKRNEVVRLLLTEGADQTVADWEEYTPLHYAVQHGSNELVHILLTAARSDGVKNKFCRDGLAPLHLAAIGGHDSIMQLLIASRADINTKDLKSGRTPFFFAVEKGNSRCIETLVMFKAKVNEPNFAGQLPPIKLSKVNQIDEVKYKEDNKSPEKSANLKRLFHLGENTTNIIEKKKVNLNSSSRSKKKGLCLSLEKSFVELLAPIHELEKQRGNNSLSQSQSRREGKHVPTILNHSTQHSRYNPSPDTNISLDDNTSLSTSEYPSYHPMIASDNPMLPNDAQVCNILVTTNISNPSDNASVIKPCTSEISTKDVMHTSESLDSSMEPIQMSKLNEINSPNLLTTSLLPGSSRNSRNDELKKTRQYPLSRFFSQTQKPVDENTKVSSIACERSTIREKVQPLPKEVEENISDNIKTNQPSTSQPQIEESHKNSTQNFDNHFQYNAKVGLSEDKNNEGHSPIKCTSSKSKTEVYEQNSEVAKFSDNTNAIDSEKGNSSRDGLIFPQIDPSFFQERSNGSFLNSNGEPEIKVGSKQNDSNTKNTKQKRSKRKTSRQNSNDESCTVDKQPLEFSNASNIKTRQSKRRKELPDLKPITIPSKRKNRKSSDNLSETLDELPVETSKRISKRGRKPVCLNRDFLYK
uniref:Uncharacterized protein n=1 Tax=Graphocephala atropunctata TaxID=36148 RepID=A0A1B6LAH0_9HEMI